MILLWLDDMRNPFEDNWIKDFAPRFLEEGEIVWVKNYNEFVNWIKFNGLPNTIAFDHDLGEDVAREKVEKGMSKRQARIQKRETKSGFECAKWLTEYCMDNNKKLPNWVIQSANPVGAENIAKLLINFSKHFNN